MPSNVVDAHLAEQSSLCWAGVDQIHPTGKLAGIMTILFEQTDQMLGLKQSILGWDLFASWLQQMLVGYNLWASGPAVAISSHTYGHRWQKGETDPG